MSEVKMAALTLTVRAAKELKDMMVEQEKTSSALRVWVEGGGCSGLSYGMAIDDGDPEESDNIFHQEGIKVYIDSLSIQYMEGAIVDYVDDTLGGGFKIDNPNAVSSCGCGSSFKTSDCDVPEGSGCGSGGCCSH